MKVVPMRASRAFSVSLLLHVGGHLDQLVDHLGQVALHDDGVVVSEVTEQHEGALLGLPLHGGERLVQHRCDDAHRVSVGLVEDGIASGLSGGGSLGRSQVVQDERKNVHQVGLDPLVASLAQGLNHLESLVSHIGRGGSHVGLQGLEETRSLEGENSGGVHNFDISRSECGHYSC
jgi:hypothetical protein